MIWAASGFFLAFWLVGAAAMLVQVYMDEGRLTTLSVLACIFWLVVVGIGLFGYYRDAERKKRWMDAILPYVVVGDTEDGEHWGLWVIAPKQRDHEAVAALYWRMAQTDEEERKQEEGIAGWGPDKATMLDEFSKEIDRASRS